LPGAARRINVLLRTTGDPLSVATAARGQAQALNANQPVFNVRTMEQLVAASITGQRFSLVLLALFAGLALVLATVGIYGVMSSVVEQRTREIGIRLALGATRAAILGHILRWGTTLVLIGTVAGVAAAIGLSQFITSLLFGIAATDATTLAAVVAGVLAVGTIACSIPAWRASRLDPLPLIRED
jgi:ABC-type antimicrobial peptide transport system permease subunit